ncbi:MULTISPECIES: hypothetical protein [Enterobacterales]|uniref:hypothetical protein n=1 Tax=Enterobacterales TaxID=91347 RepID=UPI002ED91BEA
MKLHNEKTPPERGFRLLTKKEKAWFFLLCGEQPKINKLIFLVYYSQIKDKPRQAGVCEANQALTN